jgi:acetyl esterase/lipase
MVGFSAGGHLAIATATSFEKRTYEPIDEVDKISCRPDFAILAYPGYLKAKDKDELAPGLRIPAGTPPVFLAHGGDDIISPPQQVSILPTEPAQFLRDDPFGLGFPRARIQVSGEGIHRSDP